MTKPVGDILGPRTEEFKTILVPKNPKTEYLYKTWDNIKQRITNPNNPDYPRYGGRGIGMYSPWFTSYAMFEEYVLTNLGERPENHSLDRIDNDLGYEPGNLRWATSKMQAQNKHAGNRYVNSKTRAKKTQQQTENIANYLVDKFNSPQFRPIFLKAAWRLSEERINSIVEEAFTRARNPRAYFIASVKRERAYNE